MEKLTLENIACYLPNELKFISELDKPKHEYGKNPIHTANGIIHLFGDYCLNSKELNDAYPVHLCQLILRPMSDLTKPIIIEGKEVTPIVELFEMCFNNIHSYLPEYERKQILLDEPTHGLIVQIDSYRYGFTFDFDPDNDWVEFSLTYNNGSDLKINQIQLFQWLYKNKFDVFGLIEKSLANIQPLH